MNSDYIFVDRLEIPTRVGISNEERAFPQILFISLRLGVNLKKAGTTDDLSDSVDYARVINAIRSATTKTSFQLVETVAETVANVALTFAGEGWAEIRVAKKIFPDVEAVGVFIRREVKNA